MTSFGGESRNSAGDLMFADRHDAGRRLARRLLFLRGEGVVVAGLPRGGVPVAWEVAKALSAPLDVVVVRKLGVPLQPELAMGAIGEGGTLVLDADVIERAAVSDEDIARVEQRERRALEHRVQRLRSRHPRIDLADRTVVVVDDGVATGSTARAACKVVQEQGASRVLLGVPIAPPETIARLGGEVEMVCVETSPDMWAVGQWYHDFSQVTDDEVDTLLDRANQELPPPPSR